MSAIKLHHALLLLGVWATQITSANTFTVTSTADDGSPGTLRAALNAAVNGDTINLTGVSGTIALSDGELAIEKNVTIVGPGPGQLTVDGQFDSRVFYIAPGSVVTISGLTIANGFDSYITSYGAGGGILNELGTLTVSNCVVTGNSAELGAGIFNDGGYLLFGEASGTATLNLIDSTITGNASDFGVGGGLLNANFEGNTAAASIERCTLSDNSAPAGGGIFSSGADVSVNIFNSTLSGNVATDGPGGGIFDDLSSLLVVNNSTLSGNSSEWEMGSGIAVRAGTLLLRNTILNAGALGENIWVDPSEGGDVLSYGNNLSSDNGSGYLTTAGDLINATPLLGPLQDNGGLTFTHALLVGSPAIDAGSAIDIAGLPVTIDQRGLSRPQGSTVDIGAFELEQAPPPPPPHQYSWTGVLRPINADGSSIFKAGSTVPVKFMLTGDDAGITDLVATLSYAKLSSGVVGTINEADTKATASAGNQFRYDATSGQYIFNWSTKGLSSGAYRLFIDLGDGVEHTVDVSLK